MGVNNKLFLQSLYRSGTVSETQFKKWFDKMSKINNDDDYKVYTPCELEEAYKKKINDPDYKAVAATYALNSVELQKYKDIVASHCCDVKLCFSKGTGIGTMVYVYVPCKALFLDITDIDSW